MSLRSSAAAFVGGAIAVQAGSFVFKRWLSLSDEKAAERKRQKRRDEFRAVFGIQAPPHPSKATTHHVKRVLETLWELHDAPKRDNEAISDTLHLALLFTPLDLQAHMKLIVQPDLQALIERQQQQIYALIKEAQDEVARFVSN